MVHGGGHHNGGSGGGGGGGSGSAFASHGHGAGRHHHHHHDHNRIDRSAWWHGGNAWGYHDLQNNNNGGGGDCGHDEYRSRSHPSNEGGGSIDDGCDACCTTCCGCLVATLCCCLVCGDTDPHHHHRKSTLNWKYATLAGVAIVYWALLYVFAAFYSAGDHRFTLNVGETWQIQPPGNLWSRTSLGIQSVSVNPGLEVYEVLPVLDAPDVHAACPPLDGPTLMLRETMLTMQLEYEGYQYDYFHLNAGSVITVDATLLGGKGATNIYILQGYRALESLEHNDNSDTTFQDFRATSILKRFLGNGAGQTQPHTHVEFPVPSSDFYVVVYDNAWSGRTKLQVTATVQLATHYLQAKAPICSTKDTIQGCTWAFSNDDDRRRIQSTCILVKAVSHKEKQQEVQQKKAQAQLPGESDDAGLGNASGEGSIALELDDNQVVLVIVNAELGSTRLMVLTCLPIVALLALLLSERNRLSRCIRFFVCCGCFEDNKRYTKWAEEEKVPLKEAPVGRHSYNYGEHGTTPPLAMAPPPSNQFATKDPPIAHAVLMRTETPEIHAEGLVPIPAPRRNYAAKSSWS